MQFNDLFEMRKIVGLKLKEYIKSQGFSKVSFCKKTDISRPTLDKILNGEVDNKSTFDKHLKKILGFLSITPYALINFSSKTQSVDIVYSHNEPENYEMSKNAFEQTDLLKDILTLCSIYY